MQSVIEILKERPDINNFEKEQVLEKLFPNRSQPQFLPNETAYHPNTYPYPNKAADIVSAEFAKITKAAVLRREQLSKVPSEIRPRMGQAYVHMDSVTRVFHTLNSLITEIKRDNTQDLNALVNRYLGTMTQKDTDDYFQVYGNYDIYTDVSILFSRRRISSFDVKEYAQLPNELSSYYKFFLIVDLQNKKISKVGILTRSGKFRPVTVTQLTKH